MNLLYEKLITAFLTKAKIEREANQISQTLKTAYPNCTLPVDKTIKRFLTGETHNPRDTFLGFWAAFILDKTEAEVIDADKNQKLGDFYQAFVAKSAGSVVEKAPSVKKDATLTVSIKTERLKTMTIWFLTLAVIALLGGYVVSATKKQTSPFIEPPKPLPMSNDTTSSGGNTSKLQGLSNFKTMLKAAAEGRTSY